MKRLFIGVVIGILLMCNSVYSAVPHTFANGTVADATEVNDNMDYFEIKFSTSGGHDHDGTDSKSITTLGTLTGLTVSGVTNLQNTLSVGNTLTATANVVAVKGFIALGETNISTLTASKPVFSSSTGDLVSTGTVPINQGGTGTTSTAYCNLASNVTGTLPTANGGTGSTANANAASGVVVLDASSKLPAADGSQLTGIPTGNIVFATADFSVASNTTLANVTGLTATLTAGKTYDFEASLYAEFGAGGGKLAISGTATATYIIYDIMALDHTGLVYIIASRKTAMDGAQGVAAGAGAATFCKIKGTITVNAGGTLTVQFAQNTSNGASSNIKQGSSFCVKNIL